MRAQGITRIQLSATCCKRVRLKLRLQQGFVCCGFQVQSHQRASLPDSTGEHSGHGEGADHKPWDQTKVRPQGGGAQSDQNPARRPGDSGQVLCAVCHSGGELLCCDKCLRVYHLTCHVPSLLNSPRQVRPHEINPVNCSHTKLTLLVFFFFIFLFVWESLKCVCAMRKETPQLLSARLDLTSYFSFSQKTRVFHHSALHTFWSFYLTFALSAFQPGVVLLFVPWPVPAWDGVWLWQQNRGQDSEEGARLWGRIYFCGQTSQCFFFSFFLFNNCGTRKWF